MCQHIHYVCSYLSNEKTDNHLVQCHSCTDAESEVNDHIVEVSNNFSNETVHGQ